MKLPVSLLIIAVMALSGVSLCSAQSKTRRITCQGGVKFGSLDSAIGDCAFITKSDVGTAILSVCAASDRCSVDAEVDGEFITRLFAVKIDAVASSDPDLANGSRFRMPSNQIHCMFVAAEGRAEPNGIACDINQSFVRKPIRPRPADCEYDWGQRFELGNDTDAGLECASDWVGSDDSPVLPYGQTIRKGKIACTSEEAGLTCKNAAGHGFFLSRRAQTVF